MSARPLKSKGSKLAAFVIYLALAAVVGCILGYIDAAREDTGRQALMSSNMGLSIALGLGTLGAVVGVVYGYLWMRSIDEAAQEAHKWSWYWGGSLGMSVGVVGIVASMTAAAANWQPPAFMDRTDPAAYMALGAIVLLVLMMLGYGVAWAWWWWSRR